ncbi:MAG TPA: hypothetical protein VM008_11505 [Phycisphaerae bacterium]|nr:hypothetical protein [Phycisphaerae bacterium]
MTDAVPSLLVDPALHLTTAAALDPPQATGPGGLPWLVPGQTHEWFLANTCDAPRAGKGGYKNKSSWHPPLTLLASFAGQATQQSPARRIIWIGRNCWPTLQLLCAVTHAPVADSLRRSLFLDPLTDAERFWAIGQALRCPGIAAVVADGSGMNETVSRRLQLAAESGRSLDNDAGNGRGRGGNGGWVGGGAVGLLARPMKERESPSWAATRWQVHPASADAGDRVPAWEIELIGCRRQHREQDAPLTWLATWSYQVFRGTGALHLSPRVGLGTAATQQRSATTGQTA